MVSKRVLFHFPIRMRLISKTMILLSLLFLIGCATPEAQESAQINSSTSNERNLLYSSALNNPVENIKINLPVMVGSGHTVLKNGNAVNVQLVLNQAAYNPYPAESFWSSWWTGLLNAVVINEKGERITTPIQNSESDSQMWRIGSKVSEDSTCIAPFVIEFDDYNSDGNPDFTIGLIRESYFLYTILPDGNVKTIPHDPISYSIGHQHSIKLYKTGPYSFSIFNFNQGDYLLTPEEEEQWRKFSIVRFVEEQYEWDGFSFKQTKKIPRENLDDVPEVKDLI